MKNRLTKQGIITTILGLAILGAAGYFIHKDMDNGSALKDAASAVSGWILAGVMLLRSKDSLIGINLNRAKLDAVARDNGVDPN